MARKTRIEYEDACYHVINRGNYRSWIFESAGARKSFLACSEKTCTTIGRRETEMEASRKGADWKVALARHLRERHLTPYRWIATNLKMGAPSYVQSLICLHRKNKDSKLWKQLLKQG
jgi:hypothetical protein